MHNFADVASPLTELTGKHAQFKWESTHQHAFDTLKHALTNPPILDYPKQQDTFVLTTDTSDTGLGAVLSTARGTVVEYASHTLTKTERNYSTTEKECLAIVWSTEASPCRCTFCHRDRPQTFGVARVEAIQPCTFTKARKMGLIVVWIRFFNCVQTGITEPACRCSLLETCHIDSHRYGSGQCSDSSCSEVRSSIQHHYSTDVTQEKPLFAGSSPEVIPSNLHTTSIHIILQSENSNNA